MTTTTTITPKEVEKEEKEMTLEEEKEVKRQVVLKTCIQYCTGTSDFLVLSQIGKVLEAEAEAGVGVEEKNKNDLQRGLECKIVTGGETNFAYKLFLKNDPSKALFAKLGFDYALWNPDRSVLYDLKRMDNEFELMQRYSVLMKDRDTTMGGFTSTPISQPYHLIEIDQHSKLLISEWTDGDEQWANQFIEGIVDKRVLPKLAKALATLNTTKDFDPTFNDNARPAVTSMVPILKVIFQNTIDSYNGNGTGIVTSAVAVADPHDASIQLATEIGHDEFNLMIDKWINSYMNDRQCLIHNDAHCFNILVEKKPSISTLENFGPNGSVFLIDWEMAVAGPYGADPGKVIFYPIACAIVHAMNGNKLEAYHILDCINEFWNHYESYIIDMKGINDADDEAFMIDLYRSTLGWAGSIAYVVFYQLNIFNDTMPVQELSSEQKSEVKGRYASVSLKLMKFAYGSDRRVDLSLEESKAFFNDLLTTEIEELIAITAATAAAAPCNRRRSSMLRTTGKRVSVSEEVIAEVQRRMSSQ